MDSFLIKTDEDGTDVTFGVNQVIRVPVLSGTLISKRTLFELLMNDTEMYQVLNLDDNSLNAFNKSTAHMGAFHHKMAIIKPKSTPITKATLNSKTFKAVINYLSSGIGFTNVRISDFSIIDSTMNDPIPTAIFTGIEEDFSKMINYPEHYMPRLDVGFSEETRDFYASMWAVCCSAMEMWLGVENLFESTNPGMGAKLLLSIVGNYGFEDIAATNEVVLSQAGYKLTVTPDGMVFNLIQDGELARDIHSCFAHFMKERGGMNFQLPKFVTDDYITYTGGDYGNMGFASNLREFEAKFMNFASEPYDTDSLSEIMAVYYNERVQQKAEDKNVVHALNMLRKTFMVYFTP